MQLEFRPVTMENRAQAESLELFPEQLGFIESVSECMAEADGMEEWKPVGIYDEEELIGFAMYGCFKEPLAEERTKEQVWLDRLLIGRAYQGKGYGKAAVAALIQRLSSEYNCDTIYLSVYDDNAAAIDLYKKAGFDFNGKYDTKGERIMAVPCARY